MNNNQSFPRPIPRQSSSAFRAAQPISETQQAAPVAQGHSQQSQGQQNEAEAHITKTGKIDRRFKGYRDLPPQPKEENTNGRVFSGMHITKNGKPDARYLENRSKTQAEVMREWANVLEKAPEEILETK